ncbi:class I SAM-dependent methyltransferase [Bacteroidota bacterium]
MNSYVHGYNESESKRLNDQSVTLQELLHHDSVWDPGSYILEAGCGIGSQTRIIARRNPDSNFLSIDISGESVNSAKERIDSENIHNVNFQVADIMALPFEDESFDHVFLCFVLEHLPGTRALTELKRILKKGGSLMLIEGDHGSTFLHPDSSEAHQAIDYLVTLQKRKGGDGNIGRKLYPLLVENGFKDVRVSPRFVYADSSLPEMVEGFTRNTFAAMIEGIRTGVYEDQHMDNIVFEKGVEALYRAAEDNGVFCYTFFKGFGLKCL